MSVQRDSPVLTTCLWTGQLVDTAYVKKAAQPRGRHTREACSICTHIHTQYVHDYLAVSTLHSCMQALDGLSDLISATSCNAGITCCANAAFLCRPRECSATVQQCTPVHSYACVHTLSRMQHNVRECEALHPEWLLPPVPSALRLRLRPRGAHRCREHVFPSPTRSMCRKMTLCRQQPCAPRRGAGSPSQA